MYHVSSFKAFVVRAIDSGEHDLTYVLFTEELGKLYVTARGIKKQLAKHRMNMQPLALVSIDVVRGQGGWRLIGSTQHDSFWIKAPVTVQRIWGRVLSIVVDLTPIEQPEPSLFQILLDMFTAVRQVPEGAQSYQEARLVARVLDILGWWNGERPLNEMLKDTSDPKTFIQVVNQGLEAAYS